MNKITKQADYKDVMTKIDMLMSKGSSNVSKNELNEIRMLAESAQQYEQAAYVVEAPTTLIGMIEMRAWSRFFESYS